VRVATVFRDEFKRSSWIIFIVLGCMLLCGVSLTSVLRDSFENIIGGGWYISCVNTVSWYLPVSVLLALSQSRTKKDDFWGSMPYTANSLYILRLLYGIIFIAAVGLIQLIISALILRKYVFLMEDISYLGFELKGIYAYPQFLIINIGAYIISNTVYGLFNNRFAASAMLFFINLMPEMLFTPIQWVCQYYPEVLDALSEVKYIIAYGIGDVYVKSSVYTIGYPVYTAIIAAMLVMGLYINKKSHERGSGRLFYNKSVKVIFILLFVLFILNIMETVFLQGGL